MHDSDRDLEGWIEFVSRSTHIAEEWSTRVGVQDWLSEHYRRKFRLAGHLARRTDGRWSTRVLDVVPAGGSRARGHPSMRWTDDLNRFSFVAHGLEAGQWIELTGNREMWASLESAFVTFWVR